MTQATDYQTRQQLKIEVQPIPQSNIAVSERVAEPILIEVIPPGSDSPVLIKRQGESNFSPVKGGELVRRQHTEPKSLPPVQHSKFVNEQSSGVGFKSEWRTKKPRSPAPSSPAPSFQTNTGGDAIDQGIADVITPYTLGVLDELRNLPNHARRYKQFEATTKDYVEFPVYDLGRKTVHDSRETLNNVWDDLKETWDNLPKLRLPEIDLPTVKFPDFELPRIDLPKLDLPEFQLPDLKTPDFELPNPDDLRGILPDFKLPNWLIEFPPINPQEIQRQQDIEDIREREKERERTTEPETKIIVKKLIEQLDEGCVLFLNFARVRTKRFDRYEFIGGRRVPIFIPSNWEPAKIDAYSNGTPRDSKYSLLTGESEGQYAEYLNPYYINTTRSPSYDPSLQNYQEVFKYRTDIWRDSEAGETSTTTEIQTFHLTIPRTFRPGQEPNHSDLSNLLYNDLTGSYFYDQSSGVVITDIGAFTFLNASSTCPIDLPPDKPLIPPLPPEDDMQCSCEDIALIFRKTLQSMKYKIKVPIVSCELENDRWLPKVAYKDLEVFAVDAATATSQAEVYREMAIQAKELCYAKNVIEQVDKLSKTVGVDEYPASLPASLISKDEGFIGNLIPNPNVEIKNLTQLIGWFIERFDEIVGQFEIPIEVKDSDPTTPGDQPKGIKLPNIAEAIAELFTLTLQTNINSEVLLNAQVRDLIEGASDKQQNFITYKLIQALTDYLGYKTKDISADMPLSITLNKTRYDEILKESVVKVPVQELDEKFGLEIDLMKFRKAASILDSVYFRKLNPNGDIKQQILDYLLKTHRDVNKVAENKDDFDEFIQQVEEGFLGVPGVNDPTHPYGRDYSERPRIRDLSKYKPEGEQ